MCRITALSQRHSRAAVFGNEKIGKLYFRVYKKKKKKEKQGLIPSNNLAREIIFTSRPSFGGENNWMREEGYRGQSRAKSLV